MVNTSIIEVIQETRKIIGNSLKNDCVKKFQNKNILKIHDITKIDTSTLSLIFRGKVRQGKRQFLTLTNAEILRNLLGKSQLIEIYFISDNDILYLSEVLLKKAIENVTIQKASKMEDKLINMLDDYFQNSSMSNLCDNAKIIQFCFENSNEIINSFRMKMSLLPDQFESLEFESQIKAWIFEDFVFLV